MRGLYITASWFCFPPVPCLTVPTSLRPACLTSRIKLQMSRPITVPLAASLKPRATPAHLARTQETPVRCYLCSRDE
ncbi:hypothetical protein F5141DRAFT_1095776 [Pisolithus sp. B1]|nr:hypothetical protein F5141DRAFT_1095776 [Pisolithus sp. B1]